MAHTWKEQLQTLLIAEFGKKQGSALSTKYLDAFSPGYVSDCTPEIALSDICHIERLNEKNPLVLSLNTSTKPSDHPLHLRLFQWQQSIPLSDILPMLENFDLRALNDCPYRLTLDNGQPIYISDFCVAYLKAPLDTKKIETLFQDAFQHVYFGLSENDGFNKLLLSASISWREIMILRAYAKYLRQIEFRFSQAYIENAVVNNADITKQLVALFIARHDPSNKSKATALSDKIEQTILQMLDAVSSLDEDRIIRRLLNLIKVTVRTNYFQLNAEGFPKEYLSIKLSSREITELPLPAPIFEIFVYSPRFEAIHLRNAKVARGGIRWSDRREDFRTEVLSLMKAQTVKNSVIVPSGAKGGFVLKAVPAQTTREMLQVEVIWCYKSFIRGLLDLTDNIVDKKVIRPKNVVCYDDEDTYLVVAADKGTATFSDIANSISLEYKFWLGDAFASGGSAGYDHKKMGITARGAWESIKRHFREFNIDPLKTDITVIGIGDMSGDVFGNGLLYTNHIRLIAAFDHRDIFIDPDPDATTSFNERERLFQLPTSSWQDYNAKLISKGGGVFKRSLKSIPLTAQMKNALGVQDNALSPNDLIRAILKAPVDLLYNGGIGTYVKSRTESQADVGDRTNEYLRINGEELRCKVVGEGGNLGFTQLGRVEYALKGGLINTDFIDNSGGVDCSDHEVNLKILLDYEVNKGNLPAKKRNPLLTSMTDDIAELVLKDNYNQALVMSFTAYHSIKNIGLHQSYIKELESIGILNRKLEFLPDDKQILERKAAGIGLTRPELAILLAYTKIYIKEELLKSTLLEDVYLRQVVFTAFPHSVRAKYRAGIENHPLHREIIATQLSNHIINEMGITFVYRLQMETGTTIEEIVRAHAVASHIYGTKELQKIIELLDFKIPMPTQYEMLFNIRNLISLTTRWFLYSNYLKDDLEPTIEHFTTRIDALKDIIPTLMGGYTKKYFESLTEQFMVIGIPPAVAKMIATYRAIYTTLNIIHVAKLHGYDLIKTAKVYFAAGERMHLLWFRDQIAHDTREGHWNTLARLTLRDELDAAQRSLTVAIMNENKKESNPDKLINQWIADNKRPVERWDKLLSLLHGSSDVDYTMLFIAMREILGLITTTQ